MTTSQQFEEAYIQLETMRQIKVEKISNEYKFSIKCCWKSSKRIIQPLEQDIGKCSRRTYEFEPIKELVLTMPFGFIDSLKKGWNNINKRWPEKLNQHLKNAGNRSIKQICLKQHWYIEFGFIGKEDTSTNREE